MAKKKPPKHLQCSNCGLPATYDGGADGLYFTDDGKQLGGDASCPRCGKTGTAVYLKTK